MRGPAVSVGAALRHNRDMTPPVDAQSALAVLEIAEKLYEKMVEQQRAKVLRLAREAVPHISSEDVMNPMDFPALKQHPTFEYEDGLLNGLIAAQIALRAEIRQRVLPPLPDPRELP